VPPTTRGFTNQEQIAAICAVNLNARVYDPTIARFTAPDRALLDEETDPQDLNRFSYVANRPTIFVDPTGNETEVVVVVAGPFPLAATLVTDNWVATLGLLPTRPGLLGLPIGISIQATSAPSAGPGTASKPTHGGSSSGPPSGTTKAPTEQDLSDAGRQKDPVDKSGRLTKAGRALEKHGSRPGSAFPPAKGTPEEKNEQGQEVLDDILTDPGARITVEPGGRITVWDSQGRGAQWNSDGSFKGFREPGRP